MFPKKVVRNSKIYIDLSFGMKIHQFVITLVSFCISVLLCCIYIVEKNHKSNRKYFLIHKVQLFEIIKHSNKSKILNISQRLW